MLMPSFCWPLVVLRRRRCDRLCWRGDGWSAGLHCRRRLRARDGQTVADIERGGRLDVVGLGNLIDRLVVAMRDFAQRVARRDHVNVRIAGGARGRRGCRHGGARRRRGCDPRGLVARNDQSLAGMKACGRGDIVGLHDD